MKKTLLICIASFLWITTSIAQAPGPAVLKLKSPETFKALFKTTKGDFIVEAYRKWSPYGVDRLYQLIKTGFFTNALLFRVEPDYVVQFGVSANYAANRFWDPLKLIDEPAMLKNTKGTISFARGGRNNRATQIFINMVDNPKLDTTVRGGVKGYTPIARVIAGMEKVATLNHRYGKKPAAIQDSLYKYGNSYFDRQFPGRDKILSATIVK